jgi:ADP-ribosylglycohydrolase
MEMKGGGVFNLHKGQFTDDSELAYHLLKGLTTLETSLPLSAQTDQILLRISHEYVDWGNSKPFDMGITCKKGIEVLEISNIFEGNSKTKPKRDVYIQELLGKVKEVNSKSQSNGSLMRIAPMPIFFSLLKENP